MDNETNDIKLTTLSQAPMTYTHQEREYVSDIWGTKVVTNVSQPTLETYRPSASQQTDTAVIIAPGGGLYAQSIESEGRDVAHWLNRKGITAFVLRYRLMPTSYDGVADLEVDWQADYQQSVAKAKLTLPYAVDDALTAMEYVRTRASKYGINPSKIGLMGFSAGGSVALGASYRYQSNSKPDFVVPVYPWIDVVNIEQPKADAPPMIIVCATDDSLGLAKGALNLYNSYLAAEKHVALHMYDEGGHGFGMNKQGLPSDTWIERVYDWLVAENWVGN
ncbi:alpha/beta hydrolase [Thalassotalea maritima]|uniref:alpha/beta hydrolase n=1 Tax=Thalassotalea maritima TaxID=3242416 RepID=UPI00352990CA